VEERETGDVLRVPVVEERLIPQTSWTEAGEVQVTKQVRTSVEELDVPVHYEEAIVERVPVNRVLADNETPAPRQEGDVLIVPVVHEHLVVVKQRVLAEEIRISKRVQTRTQHVAEEVSREEVNLTHPGLNAHSAQG